MAFDPNSSAPVGATGAGFNPDATDNAPARRRGEQLPGALRGVASVTQGPSMGWSDEILGALYAGIRTGLELGQNGQGFGANYEQGRDMFRGAVAKEQRDNPVLSAGTQLAASAPLMLWQGPVNAVRGTGVLANTGRAMITGGTTGTIVGAGQSEADTVAGVAEDALRSGAESAVISGGVSAGVGGIASAGRNMTARTPTERGRVVARDYAREKTAEALTRDARGRVAQGSTQAAVAQAENRLRQMGPDARLVDAGGANTMQLLDTQVVAPGRTKDAAVRAIRQRQATQYNRIVGGADEALGTELRGYVNSIDDFDRARQQAAGPLYKQLDGLQFGVDKDVANLLARSSDYHREAEKLARIDGSPINLDLVPEGGRVSLRSLDTLKQSLFDAKEAALRQGNKTLANKLNQLRIDLTNKLDELSPKDANGQSVYKLARDAWGGPSSSIAAAEAGRRAMKSDAITLAEDMKGLSASELEAFRIGAAQSLRDMAGTEAGRTRLIKFWKEPATSGKLKEIFGGDFNQFRKTLLVEGRMKNLESVRANSKTAERLQAADDLDVSAVGDTAQAAADASRGSLLGLLQSGPRAISSGLATPEPVRDEIGRILLSQGPQAKNELLLLLDTADRLNAERARRAAGAGSFTGAAILPFLTSLSQ